VRRAAPFLLVLTLAACGGHRHPVSVANPCAFPPPPQAASAAAAPTPAALVTGALEKALAAQDVHVDLRLSLAARYDSRRARRPQPRSTFPARRLEVLAAHPWCLAFSGVRTREGVSGSGVLEQAGMRTPFDLALSHRGFYLRVSGRWTGAKQFSPAGMFSSESVAGLIPQAACIRAQSEGCDKVDLHRLVRSGLLGRALTGRVGRLANGWLLDGTVDSEGLVRLMGTLGDPADYDPYARDGRAVFAVGRDGLPTLFELRWRLDRAALIEHGGFDALNSPITSQALHLRIALSRWEESAPIRVPSSYAAMSQSFGMRLFLGFEYVLGLYG